MKRSIDHFLIHWKDNSRRKPLLVRGARQVGKTHSIRQLGTLFETFIEINLEEKPSIAEIFNKDLDAATVIQSLSYLIDKPIIAGKTLLFIDEIQAAPRALIALRYLYEQLPELHVIAAGSLLEFAIADVGIPVGRVSSLYMYPLSFIEFLFALGHIPILHALKNPHELFTPAVEDKLFTLLGHYIALGGMPEIVQCWKDTQSIFECSQIQSSIIETYQQDFGKYASKFQQKYIRPVFNAIPIQLGKKFKYSDIDGEFRKRELAPCLDLLEMAGIAHKIMRTAAQGLPLGAQIDPQYYKVLFLDIGLAQTVMGLKPNQWFLNPLKEIVNKGELVESFVGQELLAYSNPMTQHDLYYWVREKRGSEAEIDYVIQQNELILPIEVKSGHGTTLKSLRDFLKSHPASPFGIRFSINPPSIHERIYSYPLYTIASCINPDYIEQLFK